jgi:hypothetical protein
VAAKLHIDRDLSLEHDIAVLVVQSNPSSNGKMYLERVEHFKVAWLRSALHVRTLEEME